MKVSCTFDADIRKITMEPEDELEKLLLNEIAGRAEKGSKVSISKISDEFGLIVELKVNGH